jgi:hypothetical protein
LIALSLQFALSLAVPVSESSNVNATIYRTQDLGLCYDNIVSREVWRMAIDHLSRQKNGWEHEGVHGDKPLTVYDEHNHIVRLYTTKKYDRVYAAEVQKTLENLLASDWCHDNGQDHGFSEFS